MQPVTRHEIQDVIQPSPSVHCIQVFRYLDLKYKKRQNCIWLVDRYKIAYSLSNRNNIIVNLINIIVIYCAKYLRNIISYFSFAYQNALKIIFRIEINLFFFVSVVLFSQTTRRSNQSYDILSYVKIRSSSILETNLRYWV